MVCSAKRIWSLYLLWMTGVTPKLSTTALPKGLASLSTIDGAITPRRDAFADLSASGGADLPCHCPLVAAGSRSHKADGVGGGGVCEARSIWSHYFLPEQGKVSQTFSARRRKAGPLRMLSMLRLWVLAE